MNVQPSCCLDVVVYMLNCVFWRHILLEIEFKSRVDMVTKAATIAHARKLPGACHGDDFGLVEKWKSLFWAVQTVIVSSAESQQRYACVNKRAPISLP